MNKKLTFALVLVLVLILATGLVACNKKDKGPQVPDFVTPTIGATYGQTLGDLELPQGFTWEEPEDTSVGEVGSHVFHVTYTPEDTSKFQTVTGIEVTVTVSKGTPQPSTLATLNAVYGQTLANIALPTVPGGTLAWQEAATTSVGNAGEHVFHVVFTPTDSINYNVVRDIPVTVAVAKADYDMSGVTLSGGQFTYDGTVKSLAISGTLPEGVSVQYEGNGQVNAGTHVVRAHFTAGDANHNNPADLVANLIILKADIEGLSFVDSTVTYDGQDHSIQVAGLGSGMQVVYSVPNTQRSAGTYEITATISKDNYNDVVLHATLTIGKATITGITFNDGTFTYDGTVKSLAISGQLPAGVTVDYMNNGKVDAGAYEVVATFNVGNNYNALQDIPATLTIEKADIDWITFANKKVTYNGDPQSIVIQGQLPGNMTVVYQYNGVAQESVTDAGKYTVTAMFLGGDPNYNTLLDMTATLTIERAIPDYQQYIPELIVMDLSDETPQKRYFGPAVAPAGFSPHFYETDPVHDPGHYEYATPHLGMNIIYVDYDLGDDNYWPVDDIPVNVLAWDSSLYTVTGEDGEHIVYLCMLYDEENDVTIRFVDPSGGPYNWTVLRDVISSGEVVAYVYPGRHTNDEDFYDENGAIAPIAVYNTWLNDLNCTEVVETTYDWADDSSYADTKYIVIFDNTTVEPDFLDVGEVVYIYQTCEYDGSATYSFNWDGGGDYFVYFYNGLYDKTTLPAFGSLAGEWETSTIGSNEYIVYGSDAFFSADENGMLHRFVGEKVYTYQFEDEHIGYDDFTHVVWSFNNIEGDYYLFTYVFDEEVDLANIDLADYEPSSNPDFNLDWWDDPEPDYLEVNLGWYGKSLYFYVLEDDVIEPDYYYCDYEYQWYDGPLDYGTYYFDTEDHYVFKATPFNNANNVGGWYYDAVGGLVYLRFTSGGSATFVPSFDNLGILKRNVGEIVGVIDWGDREPRSWSTLTTEGIFNYLTASPADEETYAQMVKDLAEGKIEPMLSSYSYFNLRWEVEDGYYVTYLTSAPYLVFELDEDTKLLTPYVGETIYVSEVEEGRDGEDNLEWAEKFTFNEVLGRHMAFRWEAVIDGGEIVGWEISTESSAMSWEIGELSGLLSLFEWEGMWYTYDTYLLPEEGNVVSMTLYMIDTYDYLYHAYDDSGTTKYETWVVVLGRDREHDTSIAFLYMFEGKLSEDQIPTLAYLFTLDTPEKRTKAGVIEMLDRDDVEYEWSNVNWYDLGEYYQRIVLSVGGDDYDLFPYANFTRFSTIPVRYTPVLAYEYAGDYTMFFLEDARDALSNLQGMCGGKYTVDEIAHVNNYGVNGEMAWSEVKSGDDLYIGMHAFGSKYNYYLGYFEDGEFKSVTPEVCYVVEAGGQTWAYCSLNDLAYPVYYFDTTFADDEELEAALAGELDVEGVWVTQVVGDKTNEKTYVECLGMDYLTGADQYAWNYWEVINDELAEPLNDYYGEVKALLNLGVAPDDDYTYILVKFFDEWQIYYYEGTINAIAVAQDELDADNLELANPSVAIAIPKSSLFIIDGVICDVSEGTFNPVDDYEIKYWFSYNGYLYLAITAKGTNIFVEARDGEWNAIATVPADIDDISFTYIGQYMGTWYLTENDYCDFYNYDYQYDESYAFYIVDAKTGQIDFALMP